MKKGHALYQLPPAPSFHPPIEFVHYAFVTRAGNFCFISAPPTNPKPLPHPSHPSQAASYFNQQHPISRAREISAAPKDKNGNHPFSRADGSIGSVGVVEKGKMMSVSAIPTASFPLWLEREGEGGEWEGKNDEPYH